MPIILLITDLFVNGVNTISRKSYTRRFGGAGNYYFNAVAIFFSILFFLISAKGNLYFPLELIPYAVVFGACFGICNVATLKAISCGPLALTSLFMGYSTLIPTLYGIFFLNEQPNLQFFLPGLALLIVSLFLTNKPVKGEKISGKWLLYISISVITNAGCCISQTQQQVDFKEQYGSQLMILALAMVLVFYVIMMLLTERKELPQLIKGGWYNAPISGLANGANNLLVMVLRPMMSAAVLFPLISGGGLVVTLLISLFLFKERLGRVQTFGFFLGLASVILLSL
jgi:drug/metabolite transporter (DMT)-like permease